MSANVLSMAGELSSRGDPNTGRKPVVGGPSLTPEELTWLTSFIDVVGKRAASVESGHPPGDEITMAHASLPSLP
jgi:hypothetical protein